MMSKTRPVCERISLARTKAKKLLRHFLYVAALHENNAIVVFSPMLASQIPRSYAANAFNWFQATMHDFEIVRLCALWDHAGNDRESIPAVVELIDDSLFIESLVDEVRAHWRDISGRNIASLDPSLSEIGAQRQKAIQEALPDQYAALAEAELRSAVDSSHRILNNPDFLQLKNYRDMHLAHSLTTAERH